MKDFINALQFLTTLGVGRAEVSSPEKFARSMLYFPLVGLILGSILALLGYLIQLRLQPGVGGAILLVAGIMLSGGLHLDGYMDTMDGIFSGRSRERILEIMKDSRVGAHAVIAVVGMLILKYALLVEILRLKAWPVLIIMPALGRMSMGIGTALFPYARKEGLGKGFAEFFTPGRLGVTALYTGVLAGLLLNWRGVLVWVCILGWGYIFARFVSGRIGGLTGDVYGALSELGEVMCLLVAICLY
jgi:adenosylcobinamide-GDP ribazoletransferase